MGNRRWPGHAGFAAVSVLVAWALAVLGCDGGGLSVNVAATKKPTDGSGAPTAVPPGDGNVKGGIEGSPKPSGNPTSGATATPKPSPTLRSPTPVPTPTPTDPPLTTYVMDVTLLPAAIVLYAPPTAASPNALYPATQQLTAKVIKSDLTESSAVEWSVLPTDLATVDASGLLRALGPAGSGAVVAKAPGSEKSASASITVKREGGLDLEVTE